MHCCRERTMLLDAEGDAVAVGTTGTESACAFMACFTACSAAGYSIITGCGCTVSEPARSSVALRSIALVMC